MLARAGERTLNVTHPNQDDGELFAGDKRVLCKVLLFIGKNFGLTDTRVSKNKANPAGKPWRKLHNPEGWNQRLLFAFRQLCFGARRRPQTLFNSYAGFQDGDAFAFQEFALQ